jgi:hypothetical protein
MAMPCYYVSAPAFNQGRLLPASHIGHFLRSGQLSEQAVVRRPDENWWTSICSVPELAVHLKPRLELKDVLPPAVLSVIAAQYRDAVRHAAARYFDQQNDEDALTGGLGTMIGFGVNGSVDGYKWTTHASKTRGRGSGALEKPLGCDIAFEIDVTPAAGERFRKTLFAQAKSGWTGADGRLAEQAKKLLQLPGGALVIDYTEAGYRATSAQAAVAAEGNARRIALSGFRSLAEHLAVDFLSCTIGSTLVHYDPAEDSVSFEDGSPLLLRPLRVVRTAVGAEP